MIKDTMVGKNCQASRNWNRKGNGIPFLGADSIISGAAHKLKFCSVFFRVVL